MNLKSIAISGKIHEKLKSFCEPRGLKINQTIEKIILKSLQNKQELEKTAFDINLI